MLIKKGIPVSPGVVIAQAVVLDSEDQPVPRRTVPPAQIESEHRRLQHALAASIKDIEQLREQTAAKLGAELARIFAYHLGMLQDKYLVEQFRQVLDAEHVTAEYAVYSVMRRQAQMLRQQEDRLFRDRVKDFWDMERRILRHLIGDKRAQLDALRNEAAVVAHDLTPSQTAGFDKEKIRGILTDAGGQTSHTAILARALGIPAIVGLEDLTGEVNTGDTLIIDANNGVVVVNPDAAQLMEYREYVQRFAAHELSLDEMARLPAVTLDGAEITIHANIEFPSEIHAALLKGATGIGLYRTEFLYLASQAEPTEDQQYEAYKQAIDELAGKPLTIRTLDLGADKFFSPDGPQEEAESNPFLGCRSIRLCLQNLSLFKRQLRAILRASVHGPARILFPMISSVMELRQAKMILSDVMEDLEEEGLRFKRKLPVGIMIEVPSAAIQAKILAREADFFSIGTNDLIQYTVAVDRGNERIASLYSAAHPAVLQLIKDVVRAANRGKVDISLCGEMGGDPAFIPLLVGLGLRSFSITPPAIPEVKRVIRSVTMTQCRRIARRAATFDTDREVLNYLHDQLQRIIPEVFDGRSIEA